ncbi:MAG: hypothetical protein ACYCW6_27985 [Candidatus Xenobia bacterium]
MAYWLDPRAGRRRRALVRARAQHLRHRGARAVRRVVHRLEGRLTGWMARAARRWSPDTAPDCKIRERVRAHLGRIAPQVHHVELTVESGCLTVTGTLSRQVLHELGLVPGVARVEQPSVAPLRHLRHS